MKQEFICIEKALNAYGGQKMYEIKEHLGKATDTPEWNEYQCLYI